MKTSLTTLLALASTTMTLTLAACGGGSSDTAPTTTATTPAASTTAPVTTVPATADTTTPVTTTPSTSTATPVTTTPVTTTPSADPATTPVTTTPATSTAWVPAVTATWQWQLTGAVNTTYAATAYDIDLVDTATETIQALKSAGKKVICYFSAGSSENWRPDFASFQSADMGSALDGWVGERWLDTRSANVRTIMKKRLDLAKAKGCDGIEPDNVDGYTNKSGFTLTAATQLDYNRFLATEAHARGLAVALKNDVDQLDDLAGNFDMAVNEECHAYDECSGYAVFVKAGKPVFNAEYASIYKTAGSDRDALCAASKKLGLHTLVLSVDLDDSYRFSCDQ